MPSQNEYLTNVLKWSHERLQTLFSRMNNQIKALNNPEDFDAEVQCKSRVVDPLFRNGSSCMRLSEADTSWKKVLEEESRPKKYFIKFEQPGL